MKLFTNVLTAMVAFFVMVGCHHKTKVESLDSAGTKSLRIDVLWVKNKGDGMDLRIRFTNLTERGVTFKESAVRLAFEGQQGELNGNGRPILIAAGQLVTEVFKFKFEPKIAPAGVAALTINPIEVELAKGKTSETYSVKLPIKN